MTTPSSCICNEGLQVFFTDNTAYLSLCAINTQTHRKHNWHVCKTTNLWNSVEKFSTMRTVYTRSQEWILCILKSWSTRNWSQDTADMGSEPFLHRSWVMLLEFSWVLCMKHVHFSAHVCLVSSVSTHTHSHRLFCTSKHHPHPETEASQHTLLSTADRLTWDTAGTADSSRWKDSAFWPATHIA